MDNERIGKDLERYRRPPGRIGLGRGDSIFAFPDDYVCLDIETTGLNPKRNEIIEICVYRIRDRAFSDKLVSLVKPPCAIPKRITGITGITDDSVSCAPRIAELLPRIRGFIGRDLILGHNIPFDIGFINRALHRNGMPLIYNDIIDTLRISRRIKASKPHDLGAVAHYLGVTSPAHRAEADVQTTVGCFERMRDIWIHECENERCANGHCVRSRIHRCDPCRKMRQDADGFAFTVSFPSLPSDAICAM